MLVVSKDYNVSNTTVHTNPNTTTTLDSVARPTSRWILSIWKQSKMNHAYIHSNTLTTKTIIRPTSTHAYSSTTASTRSSTLRNIKSFVKTKPSWCTQLWVKLKYDFRIIKNLLTKHLEKQFPYQYYSWNLTFCWYHLYPRTIMVHYKNYSKLY